MNGVTFGAYHSYDDMLLLLTRKVIGEAAVKQYTVDVEGGHGVLDYTEFFGEPKYKNRTLKFEFSTIIASETDFLAMYSTIQDAIHGQKMKIVLDEEPNYYYYGRISVGMLSKSKCIGQMTITADCEPWKYKKNVTTVSKAVSGSASITLTNMRKRVVPTITTDAEMTIIFGGRSTTASAGTFTIPTLELSEGDNVVTVSGTGNITFNYQEGGL